MAHLKLLLPVVLLLGVSACSSTPDSEPSGGTDLEPLSGPAYGEEGAQPTENGEALDLGVEIMGVEVEEGSAQGTELGEGELMDESGRVYKPVVYFGFDESHIDDENTNLIKHYAQVLVDNPDKRVVLEGHSDEQGTPEYNLALAERRAKAVAQVMMLFGVESSRIENISYGEEMPAVLGHNEVSWQYNRRVEIKIK